MRNPMPPPRGTWRTDVPYQFYAMSRDEIVQTLMDHGYSRGVAECDADDFVAYRDGPIGSPEKEEGRNDSVSVKQPVGRFAAALERAFGPREETPTNTAATGPSRSHQKEEVEDDSAAANGVWNRIGNSLERAFGRRREI